MYAQILRAKKKNLCGFAAEVVHITNVITKKIVVFLWLQCFSVDLTNGVLRKAFIKVWQRQTAFKAWGAGRWRENTGGQPEEMSGFPLRCVECKEGWRRGGKEKP